MTGTDESASGPHPAEPVGPELTATERRLHEALVEKSPRMAVAYMGCIYALASAPNPYRLQQAAVACRDLMDLVPKAFEVGLGAFKEREGDKISPVMNEHKAATARSACRVAGSWEGEIDDPLLRLLVEVDVFVEWKQNHMPRRADVIAETFAASDPGPSRVPAEVAEINVRAWIELHSYFNTATHRETDEDEFRGRKRQLEDRLMEMLRPQTFEEFADIDALVTEVEGT